METNGLYGSLLENLAFGLFVVSSILFIFFCIKGLCLLYVSDYFGRRQDKKRLEALERDLKPGCLCAIDIKPGDESLSAYFTRSTKLYSVLACRINKVLEDDLVDVDDDRVAYSEILNYIKHGASSLRAYTLLNNQSEISSTIIHAALYLGIRRITPEYFKRLAVVLPGLSIPNYDVVGFVFLIGEYMFWFSPAMIAELDIQPMKTS